MSAESRRIAMKRMRRATLGAALLAAACSNPSTPASPTPVAPTIEQTFTGTLAVLGSNVHTFSVLQVGGIRVTLRSVDSNATVRLAIGTPTGPTCLVLQSVNVGPGAAPQLSGTATVTGSFCLSISDPGTLVQAVAYTIDLIHS